MSNRPGRDFMSYAVREYVSRDVVTADAGTSAVAGSKIMREKGVGYVIVLENTQLAGIVTEHDFVERLVAEEKEPSRVKLSEIMSTPVITVDPDLTLREAVETMAKHRIRKLPVVREGVLYGILTARDIAKHFREYEDRVERDLVRTMFRFPFPF